MTAAGREGVAAVRGAIVVPDNSPQAIRTATARLLEALARRNALTPARLVSALFTATSDLDADFPAHAARRLGWTDVPLLCAREIEVPGAMARVVRVLLTVRGVRPGHRLVPVYLDGAESLRDDLARAGTSAARPASAAAARRVAIVGVGQIGGSIGLALGRRAGWHRVGFDRDRAVLARALADGVLDEAAPSLAGACAGAAIGVAAVPVDALPAALDAMAAALPRGACLLDTGSARGPVTPALERAHARGLRVVGGHPLAGSEGRGLAAARADLFEGEGFALLPVRGPVPRIADQLVRGLGAVPRRCRPAAHDAALARTSHLPWMLACALAELGARAHAAGLSGPGFRSMTRLAASDPRIAAAFASANHREVASAWRALRRRVDARVAALGRR
jgi:monofunctional chorismate mutase